MDLFLFLGHIFTSSYCLSSNIFILCIILVVRID